MEMGDKFDKPLQEEAMKFINRALEREPEEVDLLITRAQLRVFSEDIEEAIKDATEALRIEPNNIVALTIRASLYADQEMLDEAYDDVNQILKIRPLTENAIRLRGIILSQQGKFDAAIEDFVLLSNSDRQNTFYRRQLALLYNANDEPSKAIRIFNGLLRSVPKTAWEDQPEPLQISMIFQRAAALRGRGDARLSKGAHKEAVSDYKESLELYRKINELEAKLNVEQPTPMDDGVLNNLAWVLATSPDAEVRDGKLALEYATQAAELTEFKEAHVLSTLASTYAEIGDFENAIKYIQDAIEINRIQGEKAKDKTSTDEQKESLQKEYESYQDKKPWRELEDVEAEKRARQAKEKEATKSPDDASGEDETAPSEKDTDSDQSDDTTDKPDQKDQESEDKNSEGDKN